MKKETTLARNISTADEKEKNIGERGVSNVQSKQRRRTTGN